jgi:hypothetical protein
MVAGLEASGGRRRLPSEQPLTASSVPPRVGKRQLVAGAAFMTLLAAGCGAGGSPGHDSSPTSSTSAIGSSTTPAGASSSPYQWARQLDSALSLGGGPTATISGILPPSQGTQTWTLIGSRETAAGTTSAMVWTSTTTSTWIPTTLPGSFALSQAASAAEWRTSTVVVGAVGSGSQERGAAWLSVAGGPYIAVPVASGSGPSSMHTVTASSLGLFAIGSVGGKPALWSSTNGLRWTLSTQFESLTSGTVDPEVDTVLATNNTVYAAGSVIDGTQTDAALWASGDGINWRRVSEAQAVFGGPGQRVITALASFGTGLVATGGVRTGPDWSPASWISPDGVSWSQPSEDFPMDARPQASVGGSIVRSVSSVPTLPGSTAELMAVGGTSSAQRLWQSDNGVSWSEVPMPTGAAGSSDWRATTVATTGTTTVLIDGGPGQPYVLTYGAKGWAEPSSDPREFGAVQTVAQPVDLADAAGDLILTVELDTPPQSLGGAAVKRTVYAPSSGSTWRTEPAANPALAPPSLPGGGSTAVRFGNEWVAIGEANLSPATSAASANPSGLAQSWTSVDGVHWVSHGPLDPAAGINPERPTGLCVRAGPDPALVAVGSTGPTSVAWLSADGAHWSRAAIDPPALAGGRQVMSGCIATATGLVAFGATTSPSGASIPAIWKSVAGSQWTRQSPDGFVPGSTTPLMALAHSGSTWLAVAPGPATPEEGGTSQLWLSQDGGVTWLATDSSDSALQSDGTARLDLAGFEAGVPVVAGTVAGQLAVWMGSPAPETSSSPTSA